MDAVDHLIEFNRGKRGGHTREIPSPSQEEIWGPLTAEIRASWADPLLRLEMGLPPDKPTE